MYGSCTSGYNYVTHTPVDIPHSELFTQNIHAFQ